MSNRIPYRVWNPTTKRMIYIEGGWADIDRTFITFLEDGWFVQFDNSEDDKKTIADDEDSFLMRDTGIESVNTEEPESKQIFEGDIVRHKNGYLYIVEWSSSNGHWCLVQPRIIIEPETIHAVMPLERFYTGGITGQDIKRCRIIGNRYENPELLEPPKRDVTIEEIEQEFAAGIAEDLANYNTPEYRG